MPYGLHCFRWSSAPACPHGLRLCRMAYIASAGRRPLHVHKACGQAVRRISLLLVICPCTRILGQCPRTLIKNNTPWDRQNERQTELQYQVVSTYLRAWYKGKKWFPHRTRCLTSDSVQWRHEWLRLPLGSLSLERWLWVGGYLSARLQRVH